MMSICINETFLMLMYDLMKNIIKWVAIVVLGLLKKMLEFAIDKGI